MEFLGLLFDFLLLGVGVYIYLLSRGMIKPKSPAVQKQADFFQGKYGGIMRIMAILLVAVKSLDIFLNVKSMMG